ncbi:GNAT family N-acetyltransferase [Nocardia panacis]|uniref:GNAT family N-acetyltransferase n=2 Tax=Nocardia panacis TaxID=2340916 RepID=A0A3A4KX68_9NOCA|nr:GNAT family N-acetyltransferase [Nocardia panacis]
MVAAAPPDTAEIVALRDRLAQWMVERGIQQWLPGEYPEDAVAAEVARGEWFIWRAESGALTAVARLVWRDPDFWGADDAEAGYIHGLMVAPEFRGNDLGARVVRFCAERTRSRGIGVQRLDFASDNPVLRKFYVAQGFREVRQAPLPERFRGNSTVTLMEKLLD